jgi:hypothetical protein
MRLIFVFPSNIWSYNIIRRVPKKIRSTSADIDSINNILIAI